VLDLDDLVDRTLAAIDEVLEEVGSLSSPASGG